MKQEITEDISFDDKETAYLLAHSFFNIINVILMNLQTMRVVLHQSALFRKSFSVCEHMKSVFESNPVSVQEIGRIEEYRRDILEDIGRELGAFGREIAENKRFVERAKSSVEKVFDVARIRIREFLDRLESRKQWKNFSVTALKEDLQQVFRIMADNSQERYGIVFSAEEQGSEDYLIVVNFSGEADGQIKLPVLLQDTIRDLTANARKFSLPGTTIRVVLREEEKEIILEVADQGRGIPENEIPLVVRFGIRGSNTQEHETMGGGFGLTKAYFVCKQFNGRMWIDSEISKGTTITIRIPKQNV